MATQSLATIGNAMGESKARFMAKLGDSIKWEYFCSTFLTAIEKNPALLNCSQPSLMKAAMDASQLRLITDGVLGQAYVVPYGQSAQCIVGYKGLIELCLRSKFVKKIGARAVYSNDKFDFQYGDDPFCKHKPTLDIKGELIAVYAYYEMENGVRDFEVWSYQDCMDHKIKFAKGLDKKDKSGKYTSPWRINETAMCLKTALRSITKMLPKAIEDLSTVARIEADIQDDSIIDITANEEAAAEAKKKLDKKRHNLEALKDANPEKKKDDLPLEKETKEKEPEQKSLGISDENAQPPADLPPVENCDPITASQFTEFLDKAKSLNIHHKTLAAFAKKNGFNDASQITQDKFPMMLEGLESQ